MHVCRGNAPNTYAEQGAEHTAHEHWCDSVEQYSSKMYFVWQFESQVHSNMGSLYTYRCTVTIDKAV